MKLEFNADYNAHYDFDDAQNLREIEVVDTYDISSDLDTYQSGQEVSSPWGKNQVVRAWAENGVECCLKKISINPHSMLSLQRHRGRSEIWSVLEGELTVILDGEILTIPQGHKIEIPMASAHCMVNKSKNIVVVEEIQKGVCREKDNIRLKDFLNRPTYPLTTQNEFQSYILYGEVMKQLVIEKNNP